MFDPSGFEWKIIVQTSLLAIHSSTAACATHCPYCSLQCGMQLTADELGSWTVTARDFPTNRGGLCQKGWTATELLDHPERLRTPLIRDSRSSEFRPDSWEEALDRIACAIELAQQKYGRDGVGVFGGGGLTNEKTYLLGKFAHVALRTHRSTITAGSVCPPQPPLRSIQADGGWGE